MLTPRQQREILRSVTRYARTSRSPQGSMFGRLGRQFGPFGELIGMVVDILSGGSRQPHRRDIQDAIELLTEHGFRVEPGPAPPQADQPPIVRPTRTVPTQPPAISTRTRGWVPVQPAAEAWTEETLIKTLPTRIRGAFDLLPTDIEDVSPEIEFPESSNLYSAAYDYGQKILYIRFKAEVPPVGYKEMDRPDGKGKYKVAIRAHRPGPLYSYGSAGKKIPPELFEQFVGAVSKGKWFWDNIRVRGSRWEHQFTYSLTSVSGTYVPRRATKRGLRVRSVPTVGMGRRSAVRSTLPERLR